MVEQAESSATLPAPCTVLSVHRVYVWFRLVRKFSEAKRLNTMSNSITHISIDDEWYAGAQDLEEVFQLS